MMENDKSNDASARKLHFSAENPEILSFSAYIDPSNEFGIEDRLSQINALQQIVHVASHGFIQDYILEGRVHLHVLWFDVYKGKYELQLVIVILFRRYVHVFASTRAICADRREFR
jgi:hypothetical protein